jgi:hypothetical protein
MIIDRMVNSKLVENVQEFDLKKYDNNIILDRDNIIITYEKENNKVIFNYNNNEETPQLNVEIKDFTTNKSFHIISDISLSKNYAVWCVPKDELYKETNKLLISFYEKNKILDIEFYI